MNVFVIGQGYVGLSISTSAAKAGHNVTGFDINSQLVGTLISGKSHIEGISDDLLSELLKEKALKFSNNPADISGSEVIVIAVPTPLDSKKEPDLSYVHSAADFISHNLKTKALIINESTSYPGTLRNEIAQRIEGNSALNHEYASAPERVDPGNLDFSVLNTPRIVSGITQNASYATHDFYRTFCNFVTIVETPEVAETAKLLENTFRQVNIALVNQMALITEKLGISIHNVINAAATKPFGFMKFSPGLGVGGHCIPVDPTYLLHAAKEAGVPATFIELANDVNDGMVNRIIEIVESRVGESLAGKNVCVVGLTYKPDIADLRESPSIRLISKLRAMGSNVKWNDSLVSGWNGEISSAVSEGDIVIIATRHSNLELEMVRRAKFVFDCTGNTKEFETF